MTRAIEAVIFDLFGTLIYISDDRKPYHSLVQAAGLVLAAELEVAYRVCLTENLANMSLVAKRFWPDQQIDTSSYESALQTEVASCTLYPETLETLADLRQMGIRCGLASNLSTPYVSAFYRLGLDKYIMQPTFSCEEGTLKPERKIYEIALARASVSPSQALMVGDKYENDVLGPNAVGMNAVLIDRSGRSKTNHLRSLSDVVRLVESANL